MLVSKSPGFLKFLRFLRFLGFQEFQEFLRFQGFQGLLRYGKDGVCLRQVVSFWRFGG
jgi:hypothetical protein